MVTSIDNDDDEMDSTDKIKNEIRAILNSATDKELTKQWIIEALDEQSGHIVVVGKTGNINYTAHDAIITLSSSPSVEITETAPSFIEKCEVKVNPDSKSSVKSKIMDMATNQAIGQVIREIIEQIGNFL
ncbi:hypothetical protein H4J45_07410 [Colwellia sp. BRX10-6]|uniref:hypothetical protein n=1 Tax=unclassified Colwellia TaxID=196834 RepID=UPI0015F737BA|nr:MULTISPECIES: hypothetical protein [unclassified Colwellia]MBA6353174.1 hypothetical protein [Colwellia sp. BRX9-1]MBA6383844.1 hypothetical protein [Colwellia sp. BRX10-9]MBA6393914.1 hypothetical protein [Colwellia sp. BRX10-6]